MKFSKKKNEKLMVVKISVVILNIINQYVYIWIFSAVQKQHTVIENYVQLMYAHSSVRKTII